MFLYIFCISVMVFGVLWLVLIKMVYLWLNRLGMAVFGFENFVFVIGWVVIYCLCFGCMFMVLSSFVLVEFILMIIWFLIRLRICGSSVSIVLIGVVRMISLVVFIFLFRGMFLLMSCCWMALFRFFWLVLILMMWLVKLFFFKVMASDLLISLILIIVIVIFNLKCKFVLMWFIWAVGNVKVFYLMVF